MSKEAMKSPKMFSCLDLDKSRSHTLCSLTYNNTHNSLWKFVTSTYHTELSQSNVNSQTFKSFYRSPNAFW